MSGTSFFSPNQQCQSAEGLMGTFLQATGCMACHPANGVNAVKADVVNTGDNLCAGN